MPNIKIQINNLPQIQAAFRKSPALMANELNLAIRKTVFNIQGKESIEYRSLGIKVITGGLINSIRRGSHFSNLKGEVGPNVTGSPGVGYAAYVHDGTRFMKSRPFLLNSVNQADNDTEKYFITAVENVLNKIGDSI